MYLFIYFLSIFCYLCVFKREREREKERERERSIGMYVRKYVYNMSAFVCVRVRVCVCEVKGVHGINPSFECPLGNYVKENGV